MRKRGGFIDEKRKLHFIDAKAKAQEGQVSHPGPHGYLVQCSGFEPRACKHTHCGAPLSRNVGCS